MTHELIKQAITDIGQPDVTLVRLPLTDSEIRIDGGTQSRMALHQATVDEYAEAIRAGAVMPPVVMFDDGEKMWLADGFHRYHAYLAAEATEIDCEVHEGSLRDAILYSVRANANHGLRRTNEDKRKAVMTVLKDAEWATWPQEKIAKVCGVSAGFVSKIVSHASLHGEEIKPATRTVTRNGKTYELDTSNIGKTRETEPAAPEWPFQSAPDKATDAPSVAMPMETADVALSAVVIDSELPRTVIALQAQIAALTAQLAERDARIVELETVSKELLAENEMMGRVEDADDQVKAALGEGRRFKALAENAERTLATRSGEFIERARAVTHWKNRAEKAEKAMKRAALTNEENLDIDALKAHVAELEDRLSEMADNFKETLDENDMMYKTLNSDEPLVTAVAEVTKLTEFNRVLETRIFGLMNEKNEMIRRYKGAKRDVEKLRKAQVQRAA